MPKSATEKLDVLRAKHNPAIVTRNKVLAQLARLKARGAEYQYEQAFLREAGISNLYVRLIRKEFERYTAMVNEIGKKAAKRTWFPNPAHAAQIRQEQAKIAAAMSTNPGEE